jgi:hypothetical protein
MGKASLLVVLLSLLMVLLACGGGKTPPPAEAGQSMSQNGTSAVEDDAAVADGEEAEEADLLAEEDEEDPEAVAETEPEAPSSASYLQSLSITGSPHITDSVKAELSHQEIPGGWSIEYRWWVNEEELTEHSTDTLPAGLFKPKDWLFCMATLMDDQGDTVQTLRSNRVNVIPLPPRPQLDPIPQFSIPGEFRYQIKAIDPNEPEANPGDTLTYELREPKSENITIDPKSGLITWSIDADAAPKLEKGVEISFRVISTWGTSISSSIHLKITTTTKSEQ